MIAMIHGSVQRCSGDNKVTLFTTGGVGYEIVVGKKTFEECSSRGMATLMTYLAVSETSLTLYGFLWVVDRDMLLSLITVSGIGPGTALSILDAHEAEELMGIIGRGETATLRKIKGIGEEAAAQIVLTLQKKYKEFAGPSVPVVVINEDAVLALVGLGYKKAVAQAAVEKVDQSLPLPTIISQALSYLQ